MPTPLLVTKLYVPQPGAGTIARPRLLDRLDEGLNHKLTLISAPAGFGKTTVAGRWVATCGRTVAWLSLDEADSDPARFLSYIIAALRTAAPDLGNEVLGALQTAQPPPVEPILTALLNEIATLADPIVLVLDDYHRIDAEPVDEAIAFLLDHLPPQLHLVITTREDPRLPLARLRARGQMHELRAADLRFTIDETAAFFRDAMGLTLSTSDIETLETRTEGWIAGLKLAALSMRGRHDAPEFIRNFAGDARYVVDYLVEEVLRRQPGQIRDFLLQTSILDRMCGSLCDAVTGQGHSGARLEALERANVFVVPLDDRRRWYRYHHLFADVLRAHLMDEHPDLLPELHRRASAWHQANGDLPAAIDHAFAAGDPATAAGMIELAMPAMRRTRQEMTLLGWLRALPDDVIRTRPGLSVDYAGVLLSTGAIDGVETHLRNAERALGSPAEGGHRLSGWIAIYRAGLAQARGDPAETMRHAGQAFSLLDEDDHLGRGAASGLLGLASWARGDLTTGHRMYAECMRRLRQAGYIADTFGCALAMTDIRITQGRLREAMDTCERTLRLAANPEGPPLRGAADMHVGIAELHRERNDLDAATAHLQRSRDLGEHMGLPQNPYRWRVAMARIHEAQGDLDGAFELLEEAELRYRGDLFPNARPVAAMKARIRIAQGELGEAFDWARERGLSTENALTYLHEFEHITLARLLLARYRHDERGPGIEEADRLLDRLLRSAGDGGRVGSAIEILALQALACEARNDLDRALRPLERALTLAEPEGYVRLFIDEGAPMARLLTAARARGVMPDYAGRLLAASGTSAPATAHHDSVNPAPAEPLTAREIEVLRLVAEGRSNREIADHLFLALDTIKGHNRRIFARLGVQRRTEAIARARELGLL